MRPGRYHLEDDELEDEIERILRDQKTHELTCPVCDSCVTKGLIIRKRKRLLGSTAEDTDRLAKSRRNCEEAIYSLINRRQEVYAVHERSQESRSTPAIIIDVDTDPEDEECWGCAPCLPCFSFFCRRGPGRLERQRSMRNAADYGPDDLTPLLR